MSSFGVNPGSHLAPDSAQVAAGGVVLSSGAAKALAARSGETVTLAGHRLTVAAIAGDASYSHTPVVWISLADWQAFSPAPGAGGDHATVIALTTNTSAGLASADQRLHTSTVTVAGSLGAIGSYSAENGSLQLMRGFLFAISALVIGAFFTV